MSQTGSGFSFRGAKIDGIFVGPSFLVTTRIEATRDAGPGGPRKPTQVLHQICDSKMKFEIFKFRWKYRKIVWNEKTEIVTSWCDKTVTEAWQTSQCDLWHFCISVVSVWLILTPVPRPYKSHGTRCHCPLLGCCNFHHATPGGRKPSLCSRWKNLNHKQSTTTCPTCRLPTWPNMYRMNTKWPSVVDWTSTNRPWMTP